MSRGRTYLLLEMLIAIGLVTSCLIPLLRPHFVIHTEEAKSILRYQKTRLLNNAFVTLKQKIYEEEIPWDELKHKEGFLPPQKVRLSQSEDKLIKCSYRLRSIKSKDSLKLLDAHLSYTIAGEIFDQHYPLLVEKKNDA